MSALDNVCARCRSVPRWMVMSRFNTDILCQDFDARERAHPDYPTAAEAELTAVKRGEYNFPGVGKPNDL